MADREEWTDEELRAAVESYLEMGKAVRTGEALNKAAEYRALSERFPTRTAKSFEFRAQNISHVLDLQGRTWIPGLRPAKNVGTNVAIRIEAILAELENRTPNPDVAFENEARQLEGKQEDPPRGEPNPKATTSSATTYARSPEVKAWVLAEAGGVCEACGNPAPFYRADGEPFLEVHHVRYLGEGGSDTVSNAVAVCPNCHRGFHHSREREAMVDALFDRVDRLVRE